MKIRIGSGLLLINLLVIALIAVITIPSPGPLRVVLGLPFLLFFPGYVLILALFPKMRSLGGIERVALSFGLSIAVVPLLGLALNYTEWGITLESTLYSITGFIVIMSMIAWLRRSRLEGQERFNVGLQLGTLGWGGSKGDKALSVLLAISIFGAIGVLGYVIANPKVGEKFTEFYVLGVEGQASGYPEELELGETGNVIVGIINHEQETKNYRVEIISEGTIIGGLEPIVLQDGQVSEREIEFTPVVAGENKKVEFLLFIEGVTESYRSLHLYIDITESG